VALRDGFYRFYPADARLEKIAEAPYDHRTTRFNDGRCDGAGRFWAGAMFEPRTTESADMFCLERGKVRLGWGVAGGQGVKVSNGLAFSADGRSVFQADTPNHVIYRFEFDAGTGRVGNRQAFARCPDNRTESNYAGRPDGAAIDADGHYWSAQYEGSRVLRYSMQGEITGVVHMPVRRPTMVAFGGPGLRTMFITTAREGASAEELAAYPQSGGLFACDVGVAGRAEPLYVD
jgi:sugar lactone lactonase YvrE